MKNFIIDLIRFGLRLVLKPIYRRLLVSRQKREQQAIQKSRAQARSKRSPVTTSKSARR